MAKVSFFGDQQPLPFAVVSIPAICIQSDFGDFAKIPPKITFLPKSAFPR